MIQLRKTNFDFEVSIMSNPTIETILARSSYRGEYQNISVPREDLITIMEAGLAAPSGCNQQTTSIIAIDDPAVLTDVKKIITRPNLQSVPALICVLTQEIASYRGNSYHVQDYAAAIQNMLLAMKSLGYDSCWYEGYMNNEAGLGQKVADYLGVPEDYRLICVLPVGIAAEPLRKVEKKPFEQRAWFNGFPKER